MSAPPLRIEFDDTGVVSEYRVVGQQVEFRSRDPRRERTVKWRPLSAEEVRFHFQLNTVVAAWLSRRLPNEVLESVLLRKESMEGKRAA